MHDSLLEKIKENLTENETIIGKERYFNSAVLIPIVVINDKYHLLFEKRAKNIRQAGEVSFPGGEFDGNFDKNFKDTAIRETEEELGISPQYISMIGKLGTMVAPMGVSVDAYVAKLDVENLDKLNIDTNEVDRVFSIPVSHFMNNKPSEYFVKVKAYPFEKKSNGEVIESFPAEKLKLPKRYHGPWDGGSHRILVYETDEETIWGITAELVFEFCKFLK